MKRNFKIAFAFLFLVASIDVCAQESQKQKKKIVFVCEHGAARSLIASAYFNQLAAEKGLNYTSVFKGTQPDTALSQAAVKGLNEDGVKIPEQKPALLSDEDEQQASHIVTFDCTVPMDTKKPQQNWTNISPVSQNYAKARDEILQHVKALINKLERENK